MILKISNLSNSIILNPKSAVAMFDLHTSHQLQGQRPPPHLPRKLDQHLGQSHPVCQVAEPARFIRLLGYKGQQMQQFDEKEAHSEISLHF